MSNGRTGGASRAGVRGADRAAGDRLATAFAALDPQDAALRLLAVSGGGDSLALVLAAADRAARSERAGVPYAWGVVTVDHGLQEGAAARARAVAALAVRLHAAVVLVAHPQVMDRTHPPATGAWPGTEAAARTARYTALDAASAAHGGAPVLLGHTLDDQAETVLLGLARGAGARAMAGMAPVRGPYRRPWLELRRNEVHRGGRELARRLGLPWSPWDDPHNADPRFTRAAVRSTGLAGLVDVLGEGVVGNLARTATLLRRDADALDSWAARLRVEAGLGAADLSIAVLREAPVAVSTRVVRAAIRDAGAPASDLTAAHVEAVVRLWADWHGQRGVDLPGGVRAWRRGPVLHITGPAGGQATASGGTPPA